MARRKWPVIEDVNQVSTGDTLAYDAAQDLWYGQPVGGSAAAGFRAYGSTDQTSVSASGETAELDTISHDTHDGFDTGTYTYTVPASAVGLWWLNGAADFTPGTTSTSSAATGIRVNGVTIALFSRKEYQSTEGHEQWTGGTTVILSEGDTVTLWADPGDQADWTLKAGTAITWLEGFRVNDAGGGFMQGCVAYSGVVTSVPTATYTVLALELESYDATGDMHDLSTNNSRVYARTAGWYHVSGGSYTTHTTTLTLIALSKNGSTGISDGYTDGIFKQSGNTVTAAQRWAIDGYIWLDPGDYVVLLGYQATGSNQNFGYGSAAGLSINNHLQVFRVGAPDSTAPTGTVFPTSPYTGQAYIRSDLDYEEYFYDGTRWLSRTIYTATPSVNRAALPITSISAVNHTDAPVDATTANIYIMDVRYNHYIATTNDGSNYWTTVVRLFDQTLGTTADVASVNTSTWNADEFYPSTTSVNAVYSTATYVHWCLRVTGTGSPGGIYPTVEFDYRRVAT